jgi:hypothetical protein
MIQLENSRKSSGLGVGVGAKIPLSPCSTSFT